MINNFLLSIGNICKVCHKMTEPKFSGHIFSSNWNWTCLLLQLLDFFSPNTIQKLSFVRKKILHRTNGPNFFLNGPKTFNLSTTLHNEYSQQLKTSLQNDTICNLLIEKTLSSVRKKNHFHIFNVERALSTDSQFQIEHYLLKTQLNEKNVINWLSSSRLQVCPSIRFSFISSVIKHLIIRFMLNLFQLLKSWMTWKRFTVLCYEQWTSVCFIKSQP